MACGTETVPPSWCCRTTGAKGAKSLQWSISPSSCSTRSMAPWQIASLFWGMFWAGLTSLWLDLQCGMEGERAQSPAWWWRWLQLGVSHSGSLLWTCCRPECWWELCRSSDLLKMVVNISASCSPQALRTWPGTPSGPEERWGFTFLRDLHTSALVLSRD